MQVELVCFCGYRVCHGGGFLSIKAVLSPGFPIGAAVRGEDPSVVIKRCKFFANLENWRDSLVCPNCGHAAPGMEFVVFHDDPEERWERARKRENITREMSDANELLLSHPRDDDPAKAEALVRRGFVRSKRGEFEQAFEDLSTAGDLRSDSAPNEGGHWEKLARFAKAVALRDSGKPEQARKMLEQLRVDGFIRRTGEADSCLIPRLDGGFFNTEYAKRKIAGQLAACCLDMRRARGEVAEGEFSLEALGYLREGGASDIDGDSAWQLRNLQRHKRLSTETAIPVIAGRLNVFDTSDLLAAAATVVPGRDSGSFNCYSAWDGAVRKWGWLWHCGGAWNH